MLRLHTRHYLVVYWTQAAKRVCVVATRDGLAAHIRDGDTSLLTYGQTPGGMIAWLRRWGVMVDV